MLGLGHIPHVVITYHRNVDWTWSFHSCTLYGAGSLWVLTRQRTDAASERGNWRTRGAHQLGRLRSLATRRRCDRFHRSRPRAYRALLPTWRDRREASRANACTANAWPPPPARHAADVTRWRRCRPERKHWTTGATEMVKSCCSPSPNSSDVYWLAS